MPSDRPVPTPGSAPVTVMSRAFQSLLLVVFLVQAAAGVGGGVVITRHEHALRDALRYDPSWDASQAFTDWLQLETAVARLTVGSGGAGEDTALRLQLAQSALSRMAGREIAEAIGIDPVFSDLRPRMAAALATVADAIDGRAAAETALAALRHVDVSLGRLASATHAERIDVLSEQQLRLAELGNRVAAVMLAAVLCGLALVWALAHHNCRLRQAQAELRASEAQTALALEAAGAGWWSLQSGGRFACSPRAWVLAAAAGDAAGASLDGWLQAVQPDEYDRVVAAIGAERHADGHELRLHFRVRAASGLRWLLAVGRSLAGADGRVTTYGIVVDETDRVLKEQALTHEKERAERATATKSRMLTVTSHDLGQPLQSMFMIASVLEAEATSPRAAGMLRNLDRAMETMRGLLADINDVARAENGMLRPEIHAFDLDELLAEVEGAYDARAQARGLQLHVERSGLTVRSDRHLLARMVRNLVENALRYTATGGIAITTYRAERSVRIEVRDTGRGIRPEHMAAIWRAFDRGEDQVRDGEGLGLGLAIVKTLSELLDHPIEVSSTPGRGSCFVVVV